MNSSEFTAKRKHLACSQTINADVERVFPLLCPVREFDWVAGWQCEIIYSESGLAELGCVFSTFSAADGGKDIWVISRYDVNQAIQFTRVNPIRSVLYDLTLSSDDGKTRILWQQQITALNEEGNRWIGSVQQTDFETQIARLEQELNQYLQSG